MEKVLEKGHILRYYILTSQCRQLKVSKMLFHKRTKKVVKYVWIVLGVLIILSMILFFSPGLIPGVGY